MLYNEWTWYIIKYFTKCCKQSSYFGTQWIAELLSFADRDDKYLFTVLAAYIMNLAVMFSKTK